jgi:tetratricopeptide (TPR) repeat protein
MERLQVQDRIITLIARWVVELKAATPISLTDRNKISETVLIPLLGEVYDLPDLRNLNTESHNFPGIDLADDRKRVAIQVTSTATSEKIKHSLSEFVDHGFYEQYDRLIVYILVEKQKSYSGTGFDDIIQGRLQRGFDIKRDILDYRDLLEVINGFQIERAKRVLELLEANFGGEIQRPGPPLELPERPVHFKDRQEELTKLLGDLKPGAVVTLCGPGGIGKTSLAAEALWALTGGTQPPEAFPDGVLFHSFYNQPQVELAFEHLARSFGEEPRPTPALAAQRALAGKAALVLLDGAEATDSLEAVVGLRGRGCMLVTSRDRGDIVEQFQDLDPLEKADGAALLQDWGGKRAADREPAGQISELVGGLPMAIRLAGQYMQANEMEAGDYLGWLKQTPLAALDQGKRRMQSVPVLLERSLAAVSGEAAEALGAVGLLALAPFEGGAVAQALGIEGAEAGRRLGELARYGMLRRLNGAYQVTHALVHTYARTEVKAPMGSLARLGEYYNRLARTEREKGLAGYARLDSVRAHILAVLRRLADEESWEACKELAWGIEDYLDIQGHWTERVQVCQLAVKAARGLHDRWEEGAWLGILGLAYAALGEARRAIEYYEQALAIAREIGDRHGESAGLGNLGGVYSTLGETRRAIEYHEQALAIAREIGDRRGEGNRLGRMGEAYAAIGEQEKAKQYLEEALAIYEAIEAPYVAWAKQKLAELD